MIRQNVEGMISKAFELINRTAAPPEIFLMQPELIEPRSALLGPLSVNKQYNVVEAM